MCLLHCNRTCNKRESPKHDKQLIYLMNLRQNLVDLVSVCFYNNTTPVLRFSFVENIFK